MTDNQVPINPFAGQFDPLMACDAYKLAHALMYPAGTSEVFANLTPRGSRIDGVDAFVVFGIQAFIDDLVALWQPFFDADEDEVCDWYEHRLLQTVGPNGVGSDHIRALHRVGFLPLEFRALPEGTEAPVRVPVVTITNTVDHAYWLVNYIETYMAAETWQPMTSATIALHFRRMLDRHAAATSDAGEFVDWQGHDFSARGMTGLKASAASGAGHLLSFAGSDTLAARDWIENHYTVRPDAMILGSVPATEHAVMCAGAAADSEFDTFERLLDLFPIGILSVVSDTYDLWAVLTDFLPKLHERIIAREGKLVIRPDSGNPADILCGDPTAPAGSPAHRGVVELLWEVFGGTVNSKGFRELDPHIGTIYGDSITYDRGNDIASRLAAKVDSDGHGFASTNVVLGIGSFTYQYVTRDTGGFANKTTWVMVDGEAFDVWKDPVTDSGLKKSAVGRLAVLPDADGTPYRVDRATPEQEAESLLVPVWRDGQFVVRQSWDDIVDRVGVRHVR
ncbi:MAG TPA: nicotinate phosphoribosyltransferase [Ilumatobacter sp.]|nr:nicotinate phosphoribosyltransferase [Ilumatobacter sp.]